MNYIVFQILLWFPTALFLLLFSKLEFIIYSISLSFSTALIYWIIFSCDLNKNHYLVPALIGSLKG